MSDKTKSGLGNHIRIYGSMDYKPVPPIKFTAPLDIPGWGPPAPGELPKPYLSPERVERLLVPRVALGVDVLKAGTIHTPEFKQEAVARMVVLLKTKAGKTRDVKSFLKMCSEEMGVPAGSLEQWLKAAKVKVTGLRTSYTREFRARVTARALQAGANLDAIGTEEGVRRSTLLWWRSAARNAAKRAAQFTNAEADEPFSPSSKRMVVTGGLYAASKK